MLPGNSITNRYSRNVSSNDLLSIAYDRLYPFNNQFVFEGRGVLDKGKWVSAVETASAANPGSRLILKGYPFASRWVDSGITPRVREVDGSRWSGRSSDGAPFLQDRLSPTDGPTCEVLLIQGNPARIIFRTHHGVMDASGTVLWAMDIFRALRGEPVVGSDYALNDEELVKTLPQVKKEKFPANNITLGGKFREEEQGFVWLHREIPGRFQRLQAQALYIAAREARKITEGPVVFNISVDLRRHLPPETRATGFLAKSFFLEINPDYTVEKIAELIKKNFDEKREITDSTRNNLLFCVPIGLMNSIYKRISKKMHASGRYLASGICVSVGYFPLELFYDDGFSPITAFAIPPLMDVIPFFLGLGASKKEIAVTISMHRGLASHGRIEAIMDSITSQLVRMKQ